MQIAYQIYCIKSRQGYEPNRTDGSLSSAQSIRICAHPGHIPFSNSNDAKVSLVAWRRPARENAFRRSIGQGLSQVGWQEGPAYLEVDSFATIVLSSGLSCF